MRKLLMAGVAAALLAGSAGAAGAQTVVVERWGHWEPTWGVQPPPPPRRVGYWRHHERDWYGHVRHCSVTYHRYDPRRDMYYEGRRWIPCRDYDHDHDRG